MSKSWVSTLKLPKSTFPPRPLPELRPVYLQRCTDALYAWQAAHRPSRDTFVLHDGPPYANGGLHVGHALNKILKDMVLRVKLQQGRRVQYVPGWDCHGLPIEQKVVAAEGGAALSPLQMRTAARALAGKTVREQMVGFRSFGVMGDWDRRWTTMDLSYEVRQLRLFRKMVEKGLIHRKYKPVYWSPSSRTALAEAELEYNDAHVSTAAYVKMPIVAKGPLGDLVDGPLYAVVWTTTPWTLPANMAIAVHRDLEYVIVRSGKSTLVVAKACLEAVQAAGAVPTPLELIVPSIKGAELVGLEYGNMLHGRRGRSLPIIHADFVSPESGSGLVHLAPGHGFDDYDVCRPFGISIPAPVDDTGRFTHEAYPDDPAALEGLPVQGEGNHAVLKLLGNSVLAVHQYQHKYPYDWRSKQPIIVRATAQWFADVAAIKSRALEALDDVQFVPETGRKRLESFVKGRSEWCISRQRAWGVPIPALYDKNGDAALTEESVEHIISVIQARGTDAWWSDDPKDPAWVPEALRAGKNGPFRRGADTMDVWFDSGSSWTQSERAADVYLEGSDQHRGWFQSSLLTRVAAMEGEASSLLSPFRSLITHGFILDAEGKKMSKSIGNVISPEAVMQGTLLPPIKAKKKGPNAPAAFDALGPDALRLWVCSSDYTRDVVMGAPVLQAVHTSLTKYRITLKMLLGSLRESARTAPLTPLDHIAILHAHDALSTVGTALAAHDFHRAHAALNLWLAHDLSAFYLEAAKDRLYCAARASGVIEPLLAALLRMLAPVCPLLVEEAWAHAPAWLTRTAPHPLRQLLADPIVDAARLPCDEARLRAAMPALAAAHAAVRAAAEAARGDKVLGSSLACDVVLRGVPAGAGLGEYDGELAAMFVVSRVELDGAVPDAGEVAWRYAQTFEAGGVECTAWVLPPREAKCPRCWRYVAPSVEELCGRCEGVVGGLEEGQET